jgi:hypothetical protein
MRSLGCRPFLGSNSCGHAISQLLEGGSENLRMRCRGEMKLSLNLGRGVIRAPGTCSLIIVYEFKSITDIFSRGLGAQIIVNM